MKTSKSRMDSVFGFELLWKIVILYAIAISTHYFEIKEHGKQSEERSRQLAKTSNYDQNDPRFCASIIS